MIYGKLPLKIHLDTTDRVGLRTLIVSQLWQCERDRTSLADIEDQKPAVPPVPGGVMLIGVETKRSGGGFRTFWTFEGIGGDGKSTTFRDRRTSLDYGFRPGFSETDLRQHPSIERLLQDWGGYADPETGHILWPIRNPNGGGANVMFGRETFFRVEGIYRFRYLTRTMPSSAGVAKIVKTPALPGQGPKYTNRDWLMVPPAYERRGPVFEVLEQYWLSGEGGWPEPLYGRGSTGGGTV